MKQTILIRDVQLVQGGISPRCDMLIQDGVIAKLGKDLNESAHFVIDGSRLTALPGLFDMHVHLRDPGRHIKRTSSPVPQRHWLAASPVWHACRIPRRQLTA